MGDPKLRKKITRKPSHPWQKERIVEEISLLKEYGLKNKGELWKVDSRLKNFMRQAKRLIASTGEQAAKEKEQLLNKLVMMGLLDASGTVEDVLTISLKDMLNRRLQTLVEKKQLAKSLHQARQFIVHEHILVGEKKLTAPSYLVSVQEESSITFSPASVLNDPGHAERAIVEKKVVGKVNKEGESPAKKAEDDKAEDKAEIVKKDSKEGKETSAPKKSKGKEDSKDRKELKSKKESKDSAEPKEGKEGGEKDA